MSEDLRFPIVMDQDRWCYHCQMIRPHRLVIYPDNEGTTCNTCGAHKTLRYDRDAAQVLVTADKEELELVYNDLNFIAGALSSHSWGYNVGKKDKAQIESVIRQINSVAGRVRKMKDDKKRR